MHAKVHVPFASGASQISPANGSIFSTMPSIRTIAKIQTQKSRAGERGMDSATTKRTLLRGAAALAATGGILATRALQAAPSPIWEQISSTGTMRVAVISHRPPYIYDSDGTYKGFSIVMAQDLAKALEVAMGKSIKIEYVITTWPTSVLDIQSGRADIFFGFSFSPERAQAMDLIGPLYEVPEVAVLGR